MWDKNLRTGSKEGFDSGVSWDQDFTINERESERPIIKVPDKQGQDGNPITRGKRTPINGGNSPIFYSVTQSAVHKDVPLIFSGPTT